ncbi:MAG TPA: hypothetical protein VFB54_14835, partial [Burkholderiales bacterium]|nr:hypothetical protein [Burkholderiales bacterium]
MHANAYLREHQNAYEPERQAEVIAANDRPGYEEGVWSALPGRYYAEARIISLRSIFMLFVMLTALFV